MYKDSKRTCRAVVLLIKPCDGFVTFSSPNFLIFTRGHMLDLVLTEFLINIEFAKYVQKYRVYFSSISTEVARGEV